MTQFDVSSLPPGAVITSATLEMEATFVGGELNIDVYQLLEAWKEGSATWNQSSSGTNWSTAGGSYNNTAADSITKDIAGNHQWDITTLVQSWVDGSEQNNGVMIASPDGGGNRFATYDSREGTVAPVLRVTYDAAVGTLTAFQQGDANGYSSTQDTELNEPAPTTPLPDETSIAIDLSASGAAGTQTQGVVRFDNIFGDSPGQIPYGSTIHSTTLVLDASDPSTAGTSIDLHRLLTDWDENATWDSFVGGITLGSDAQTTADASVPSPGATGAKYITGTGMRDTLQAWSNGDSNYGWGIISDNGNGLDIHSSEATTQSQRPQLQVDYTAPSNAVPTGANWTRYLSQLTPAYDTFDSGKSTLDTDYNDNPIVINGVSYDYGVGTHAPGSGSDEINYAVGDATNFRATIGITDDAGSNGDVVFIVKVDGAEVYRSSTFHQGDRAIDLDIDVSAASTLTLEVENADGNDTDDHGMWAQARLEGGSISSPSIAENAANGTEVGYVAGVDPDSTESFSYALTNDAGGRFAVDSTGRLTVADASLLDFETAASHSVTVEVTDSGGLKTSQLMTIAIRDVNEAPVNLAPAVQSVNEDETLFFSSANGNALSVSDSDAGSTPLRVTLTASNGLLTLAQTTGLTFSTGDGTNDASVTFVGTLTDINAALEGSSFTPTANFFGHADIQITSDDLTLTGLDEDSNLLGFYTFDNAGNLGNDSSPGSSSNAAVNGAVASNDPERGNVIDFDGVDDSLHIPGLMGSPTDLTLTAWVNLDTVTGFGSEIISLGDVVALRAGDTGVQGFFYDGSAWHTVNSGVTIQGQGWHQLAYTFDDANNTQTLYIDGVEIASSNRSESISYSGQGANTFIGSHANGSSDFFADGRIDDARIYGRALSGAEIQALSAEAPSTASAQVRIAVNATPTDLSTGIELNTDGGNDAYLVNTNAGAIFGGLQEFSVEIDLVTVDLGQAQTLLSYEAPSGGGNELLIRYNTAGALEMQIHGGGNSVDLELNVAEIADGNKHSLAISWDNVNGSWALYLDGEFRSSGSGVATGLTLLGGGTVVLGNDQDGVGTGFDPAEYFSGTLYDVRIWNEARSAAEVALNYQHRIDSNNLPSGLVANWQMTGLSGGGSTVIDVVSGNDLTVAHASAAGFAFSSVTDTLNINENGVAGTSAGFVVPTDPDVYNDVVSDGRFLDAGIPATFQNYVSPATFGAWQVVQNSVDVLGDSYLGDPWERTPLGGLGVDLNGTAPGAIEQTLTTEIGREYQVTFAFSGNWTSDENVKDLRASAGGTSADFSVTQPAGWSTSNMLWEQRTFTFVADSTTTTLRFASLDGNNNSGPVIGDVQAIEIPAAVSTILNNDPSLDYDAATGKFYRFVDSPIDFNAALSAATGSALNGVDGQLVTIRSEYENELIRDFVLSSGNEIWLGATDAVEATGAANDGEWHWLNGTVVDDQFWTGGNGGSATPGSYAASMALSDLLGEDYIRITPTGQWADYADDQPFSYVVEWDADAVLSSYTFSLTDASNNFVIDSSTGEITVAATNTLDFEANQSHSVGVTVTDAAGSSYLEMMAIAVDNGLDANQTVPGAQTVDEDTVLTYSTANGNAISVTDSLAGTNTPMQVTLAVTDGVIALSGLSGITFVEGGQSSSTMTFNGTESDINAALEGMTFAPDANFNGTVALNMSTSLAADLNGNYSFDIDARDDSAGTVNDGTLVNGASIFNDAERGDVLLLDGTDDHVQITGMFGNPADVTLAAWVNRTSNSGSEDIISLGDNVLLRSTVGGGLRFTIRGSSGWQNFDTGYVVDNSNGWTHFAATLNNFTGAVSLYVNGELVTSGTATESIQYTQGDDTFIGKNGNGAGFQFEGMIDDARVYTRALSADEIAALASDQTTTSESVAITVDSVNDAPVNSVPVSLYTPIDTAIVFSGANGNALSVNDVDADANSLEVTLAVTNGSITLGSTALITVTGGANGSSTLTFSGSSSAINTALEGTNFTPDAAYAGLASLQMTSSDFGNSGSGGAQSDSDSFDIHVGALVVTTNNDVSNGDTSSISALINSDGGDGISLREAIQATNNTANGATPDAIHFDIADALVNCVHTISISGTGLNITDAVIIDGTTDSDFATNPLIELQGLGSPAFAGLNLTASSDGSTMKGLIINGFADGILLTNSDGNTITGNWIGTDATGLVAAGNTGGGISVVNSSNNIIGGSSALERNVISANTGDGISLSGATTTANEIQGNYIGVDITANAALGNTGDGINIRDGASSNIIGGDRLTGEGNVISGNSGTLSDGIEIDDVSSFNNISGNYIGVGANGTTEIGNARYGVVLYNGVNNTTIAGNVISANSDAGVVIDGNNNATNPTELNVFTGNFIGTDVSGTAVIGNGAEGIYIFGGASKNRVGGEALADANVTAHNSAGIVVASGLENAFLGNSIRSNSGLGIDVDDDGLVTSAGTPVLTSAATNSAGSVTLAGSLNSSASTAYRVEFFASATADVSGYGEAEIYLGFTTANTDASGFATFSASLAATIPRGYVVSSTATVDLGSSSYGSTSEFGANRIAVSEAPVLSLPGAALDYVENDGAVVIDSGATVSDADSADFNGGTLTVDFNAGSTANDRLAIRNEGTGAGQIGITGADVTYAGAIVGSFAGGDDGSTPLVVNFNANATPASAQALLRNITYQNVSEDPAEDSRTVRFLLTDGYGGESDSAVKTINVFAQNDAPALDQSQTMQLNTISEDDINNNGQTVASIIASAGGDRITDADANAKEGIAIYFNGEGQGAFEYSIDDGVSWTEVGSVSETSRLLLRDTDLLRYVPDGETGETVNIEFRAWDQTEGTAGTKINSGAVGDSTAFSSDTEEALLTVTDVNDEQTTVTNTGLTLDEGTQVTVTNSMLLTSDVDDAATNIVYTMMSVPGTGWLRLNGSAVALSGTFTQDDINNGRVSFQHDGSETTTDSFFFAVDDGQGATSSGEFSVIISALNDDPTNSGSIPTDITVIEDVASNVVLSAIELSDPDVSAGNLTLTLTTSSVGNLSAASGGGVSVGGSGTGTLTLSGTQADLNTYLDAASNVTYLHGTAHTFGDDADTINVVVNDNNNTGSGGGANQNLGTVNVDITAVNDAPVNTVPASIAVTEDVATALTGISIADVDAGSDPMVVTLSVPAGTLAATSGSGVTVGGSAAALTLTGSVADINSFIAASAVEYTTATDANGSVTLTVNTSDQGNNGSGVALSDSDDVTLNITAINDSPTIATNTGTTVAEASTGNIITTAMLNGGDVDDGGTGLTYTVTAIPGNGTLRLSGTALGVNGSFTQDDIDNNRVTYDHDGSQTTSDSFGFSLADGGEDGSTAATGSFNFSVTNVNDAPTVANPIANQVATEDAAFSFQFDVNTFDDVDGDTLTYSSDASGWLSFEAATRMFSGTPTNDHVGTTTVTVTADDGNGSTVTDTFAIVVDNTNDAPLAYDDTTALDGTEDSTSAILNATLLSNDSDIDGDAISITAINGTTLTGGVQSIAVSNGTVNISATNDITFTADANYADAVGFTYTISDGTLTDTAAASGTISAVQDAPVVDLDVDNSSGAGGANYVTIFTEDGGPVALADLLDASIYDADLENLVSLTVTIANPLDGANEWLAADTTGTAITASYDSGTAVLSLTGTESVANYEQVLRSLTYDNSSQAPDITARVITVVANDGTEDSNAVSWYPPGAQGLVGYWNLDEGMGEQAFDVSGNGNHATLTNMNPAADWVEGNTGQALNFNGTESYLEVPYSDELKPDGDFTITLWNRPDSVDTRTRVVAEYGHTQWQTDGWMINQYGDDLYWYHQSSGPTSAATNVFAVGEWTHIAISRSGDTFTLYVDGVQRDQDTKTGVVSGNHSLYFGSGAGTQNFDGTLDDVRIYDQALNAGQIAAVYQDRGATTEVNMVAVNDAPDLTAGATLTYSEGGAPAVIDDTITIVDVDSDVLVSATIQITGNRQAGGVDVLSKSPFDGISGSSWIPSTGTLTLTGDASVAQYEAALRAVMFENTSDTPSTLDRTITWTVNDGNADSLPQTSTVQVIATNDAPTDINPSSFNVDENTDTSSGYSLGTLTATDPDSGVPFTYSILSGADGAKFAIGGANNDELILTDGIVDFEMRPAYNVRVQVTDSSNASFEETLTVNVNDNNDAPTAVNDPNGNVIGLASDADTVGIWRLGESTGATAVDSAGSNDGIYNNVTLGAMGVAGDGDTAADFNGSTSHVNLGNLDLAGTGITMSAWFNADSFIEDEGRIVSHANGTAEEQHTWMLSTVTSDGEIRLRMRLSAGGQADTFAAGSGALQAGQWYHATATYDQMTGVMSLYLDGQLVGQKEHNSGGAVDQDPTREAWIGANPSGDRYFDGRIDEVVILERGLTQGEVAALAELSSADYQVDEESTLSVDAANGVLHNDYDVDGDSLTVTEVNGSSTDIGNQITLSSGALLTLNADGSFSYDPNGQFELSEGQSAADSFIYTVSDGNATNSATATVTVDGTNDAPVATNLSAPENYIEDTPLDLTDIIVSDVDSADVTVSLALSDVAAGTLNVATSGAVTSTFANGVWTASGALADVNALLVGVTFTPSANYNSNFNIATAVSDGVAPAITGSKAFTGDAVNDAPVISTAGGAVAYTENGVPVIVAGAFTVADPDSDDFNGGTLTVSFSAGGTANDRLLVTPAGAVSVLGSSVRYNGVEVATVSGGNGGAALVLSFNASSTTAIAQAIAQQIAYFNASDSPAIAARTVDFVLSDGDTGVSNVAQKTVTVAAGADAPVAVNDRFGLSFDGIDDFVNMGSDASLEVTTASMTMEAWIRPTAYNVPDGSIVLNREGEYEIGLSDTGTLRWALTNTSPGWSWHDTGVVIGLDTWTHVAVSSDDGFVSTFVNGTLVELYQGAGNIGDAHATKDDFRIGGRENSPAGQYFNGQIDEVRIWNIARSDAEIRFAMNQSLAPQAGLVGYWQFNEGSGVTTANAIGGGPAGALVDGGSGSAGPAWVGLQTAQDAPLTIDAANGVLANDLDADGDALVVSGLNGSATNVGTSVTLPSGATLTLQATGSFVYDPNGAFDSLDAGFTTTDSFSYEVSDGNGGFSTATVTLLIHGINDAPLITSDGGGASAAIEIPERTMTVTTVESSDVDGSTAVYSIVAGGDDALFSIDPGTGVLTFVTAPDFENPGDAGGNNVYNLTVQVSDGVGGVDTQAIAVTVTDVTAGIRVTPSVGPLGSETLVNTTTNGNQTSNNVVMQAVASDASGNYVVVWHGQNPGSGTGMDVYAQRFSADGTALGSEFLVNTITDSAQRMANVAMDAAGNFVIAWQSKHPDSSTGIYAQRYNVAGEAQGGEFRVSSTTPGSQDQPTIAMASDGSFVIAWNSDDGISTGIFAQRYNANGNPQGNEFLVNTFTGGAQNLPSVGMDAAGNFVITWTSANNQDGSGTGVFGQRYDASGAAQGAEFLVNSTIAASQAYADVAMLADGRFVVAWQTDTSNEIYLQRYEADGSRLGGETRVNATMISSVSSLPSVSADASGNIVVVWSYSTDGDGNGVAGQRLDWSGAALGSEFLVNTTTAGNQSPGEVVAQPGGGFVVVWVGPGADASNDIFMQRYGLSTTEAGGTATFDVVLEAAPTADVVIPVNVSDVAEGAVSVASLTFTSGNWNVAQTVTVTGLQDYSNDGDQVYTVVLGAATSADLNFNALNPADLSVTNLEVANIAPVNVVPAAQPVNEDTPLIFSIVNGNRISISDVDAGTNVVQVELSVTNGTLTLATGFSGLSFVTGDGTADASMMFTGTIDNINTALDGLRFDPTAEFSGGALLTISTNDLGNSGTGGPQTDSDTVAITVLTVNDAPAVSLSSVTTTLAEDTDTSAAIKVADITITDDTTGTNNLSLTGADAAMFTIVGSELFLNAGASLDFESNGSLDVTVQVDDSGVGTTPDDTAVLAITVTDANEAPTVSLTNTITALAEDTNTSSSIKVADIVVADDALGTNTLTLSGADAALFEIVDGTELHIKAGTALDFETNSALTVLVKIADSSNPALSDSATITINLSDIEKFEISAISDVDSTTNTLSVDAAVSTPIGITVFATDANSNDSVTYSLDDDSGGMFTIDSATGVVTLNRAPDAQSATSYSIVARATSSDGSFSTEAFQVVVQDSSVPTVETPSGGESGPALNPVEPPDFTPPNDEQSSSDTEDDNPAESTSADADPYDRRLTGTAGGVNFTEDQVRQAVAELAGQYLVPADKAIDPEQGVSVNFDDVDQAQEFKRKRAPGMDGAVLNDVMADHALWEQLEQMQREMSEVSAEQGEHELIVKIVAGSTLTASAGFVTWLLRGGSLLASFLSSMPLWKGFDPLPILATKEKITTGKHPVKDDAAVDNKEGTVDRLFQANNGRLDHEPGTP